MSVTLDFLKLAFFFFFKFNKSTLFLSIIPDKTQNPLEFELWIAIFRSHLPECSPHIDNLQEEAISWQNVRHRFSRLLLCCYLYQDKDMRSWAISSTANISQFVQSVGAVEYTDCTSTEGQDPTNECPKYDTK